MGLLENKGPSNRHPPLSQSEAEFFHCCVQKPEHLLNSKTNVSCVFYGPDDRQNSKKHT